ncbi:MAG: cupin domain-containing protein [Oscillospiraceae bacterium]
MEGAGERMARALVEALGLAPLWPEGGYYRTVYRSAQTTGGRSLLGAIYYLLGAGEYSRMHRLDTDEVYHFFAGDAVEMLLLWPDGRGERVVLGGERAAGQLPQVTAPAGCWQGARLLPGGAWALMATTTTPAFSRAGYTHGEKAALTDAWPEHAELIAQLADEPEENARKESRMV